MAPKRTAPSSKPAPPPAELPPTFSKPQAKKAVDALLSHHAKTLADRESSGKDLLPRDENIWLVVNTKRGSTHKKLKPIRIQLPHPPLPPPPQTTIALITKPPQRTYKDLLSSDQHNIKFINRVVDTDKLKGKWRPFEARRELMRENDLWLCDERVVPSLPRLLGKVFFEGKKIPIPVNLARKDLKAELGRAINSTYFHQSTGTSHSIRISTPSTTTTPAQTLENLLSAIPQVIRLIDEQWENVLSVGVKTSTSVLLPVWSSALGGRFDAKEKEKDVEGDVEMGDEGKGKKRKATAKDEGAGTEKKKVAASPAKEKSADKPAKKVEEVKPVAKKPEQTKAAARKQAASKPVGKKSSTIGSGGAGKRAKEAALGKVKSK